MSIVYQKHLRRGAPDFLTNRNLARTCGADAVLAKPFDLLEVERLLHHFLAASPS